MSFTEEQLLQKKVMFLITLEQPKRAINETLKTIFEKSFKLGISWEMEKHDGFIIFKKTNI
jgi:hypothetical protein